MAITPPTVIETYDACAALNPFPPAPRIAAPHFETLFLPAAAAEPFAAMRLDHAGALLDDLTRAAAWKVRVDAWVDAFQALCRGAGEVGHDA